MALITGTSGNDTLIGTPLEDVLTSLGGVDYISGGDGADIYALRQGSGGSDVTISDMGEDGAIDTITGGRGLFASASLGYQAWATAKRVGDDLIITLPGKPNRFRKPGYGELAITIEDQYAGAPVEYLEAGGVTYRLADSMLGTIENDIIGGTKGRDTIETFAGDDFVDAGRGNDRVVTGDGNDIVFAGEGRNYVNTGNGDDWVQSGSGNDRIYTGDGNDRINAADGNNKVISGTGNDTITTGSGNDLIKSGRGDDLIEAGAGDNQVYGGHGNDTIVTGEGDDLLSGGKGGDTYVITTLGVGTDTIIDNGNAATNRYGWLTTNMDEVEFSGYTSLDDARHSIGIELSGSDLILTHWDAASPDQAGQITVQDHLLGAKFALEQVDFGVGGFNAVYHIASLSGDDYTYSVHGGSDAGGNDIVLGTAGNDRIYGGLGDDIMIGSGGSDRFIFNNEDEDGSGNDIILDFNLAGDLLDFSDQKTATFADMTLSQSAYGNAVITHAQGSIELKGIAHADVDESIFAFDEAGTNPNPDPVGGGTVQTGTSGADLFKGTDAADRFIFDTATSLSAVDTVKDFVVSDGDVLDVSDLLIGYVPGASVVSDFVRFQGVPDENSVLMAVDIDGSGAAASFVDIAEIPDFEILDADVLFASENLFLG